MWRNIVVRRRRAPPKIAETTERRGRLDAGTSTTRGIFVVVCVMIFFQSGDDFITYVGNMSLLLKCRYVNEFPWALY